MKAIATFEGNIYGFVLFAQKSNHTRVHIHLHGLDQKMHAIHVHEYGDLRDGCKSLGGHYNPTHQHHGSIMIDPIHRHAGDMINNIQPNKDGIVDVSYNDNLLVVKEIFGRSVVIHHGVDDLGLGDNKESLITGNAGKRLACAIIGIAK